MGRQHRISDTKKVSCEGFGGMRIFVINLERRKERLAYMERQLRDLGAVYERVDAVDGKLMCQGEKKAVVSWFRWWCVNGYCARDGEIGCALSHQSVYRMMVERGLSYACIIEDDIRLDKRLWEVLKAVEERIGDGGSPEVFLLAPYLHRQDAERSEVSFRNVRWAASTGGYVLTRSAAERLLAVNVPLQSTADNWGRWNAKGGIELYDVNPIVCHQSPYGEVPDDLAFASDTVDQGTQFVKDMSTLRRLVYKSGRVVGKFIDKILP